MDFSSIEPHFIIMKLDNSRIAPYQAGATIRWIVENMLWPRVLYEILVVVLKGIDISFFRDDLFAADRMVMDEASTSRKTNRQQAGVEVFNRLDKWVLYTDASDVARGPYCI
jgi:hypothetical protein